MSEAVVESSAKDAEVASVLGLTEPDEQEEQDEEEVSEDQESDEEVRAELAELKRELARLRRENAAARIQQKQKPAAADSESTDVEAAREAGREEARAEHGIELATEAVRAALTGVIPDGDLDEFVDELNIARFVTDEHKPDRDAIASLKARQSKLLGRKTTKVSHGRQGSGTAKKSNAEQFGELLGLS